MMDNDNSSATRKPYTVRVIFEESRNFFKPPIIGKPNFTQKMAYKVSEWVFKYLILKGGMKIYLGVLAILAGGMFVLALISSLFGPINATLVNYVYMFLMFLILPFLAYFLDVYQAMQLRLGMNIAIREKLYSKIKIGDEEQQNTVKFEWVPTTLAILSAIIHEKKRSLSHGEVGKIAGVDRQTAAGAEKKLLSSGLIYEENDIYHFSGVEFEVWVRKGKKTERKQLSEDEKKRLKYLFELMCFVAF